MSSDSTKVKVSKKHQPSDLHTVAGTALSKVPAKLMFYMFIIYLLLSSDVFIKRILSNFSNAVTTFNSSTTTYGTIITGILLVISLACIDFLIKQDVI